jgi:hypothetical protein
MDPFVSARLVDTFPTPDELWAAVRDPNTEAASVVPDHAINPRDLCPAQHFLYAFASPRLAAHNLRKIFPGIPSTLEKSPLALKDPILKNIFGGFEEDDDEKHAVTVIALRHEDRAVAMVVAANLASGKAMIVTSENFDLKLKQYFKAAGNALVDLASSTGNLGEQTTSICTDLDIPSHSLKLRDALNYRLKAPVIGSNWLYNFIQGRISKSPLAPILIKANFGN